MNKFTVPKPCHENWENMLPEEQGRFCTSCHKKVYDFTEKSDQEIQEIFDIEKRNLCGKFDSEKLIYFTKFQKVVLRVENFTQNHFSKFGILVTAVSLLVMITGCEEKKNPTPLIGETKIPEENRFTKENAVVLGKIQIIETDSTTHYLKNLDHIKTVKNPPIKTEKNEITEPKTTMGVPIPISDKDSLK